MNEKLEQILGVLLKAKIFKQHIKENNAIAIPIKSRGFSKFEKEGYIGFIQIVVKEDDSVVFEFLLQDGKVRISTKRLDLKPEDVPRYLFDFQFSKLASYFNLYGRK